MVAWYCKCDCGSNSIARGPALRFGTVRSCGCLQKDTVTQRNLKHGNNYRVKGSPSSEYTTWCGMHQRCRDPKSTSFKNYGGRGISVCTRWLDFRNFLDDMGKKPSIKHTIDRKNNDGNYEPTNCYWATRIEQQKNKRGPKLNHK
jgi:hypothetical protein